MSLPLIREIEYPSAGLLPALRHAGPHAARLESVERAVGGGRHGYLLWDPYRVLEWSFPRGWSSCRGAGGGDLPDDPWSVLEAVLAELATGAPAGRSPDGSSPPPFTGGAVGYLAYELAATLERLPEIAAKPLAIPAARLALGDVVVALDHRARRACIVSQGWPATGRERTRRAHERLEAALDDWCAATASGLRATSAGPADRPSRVPVAPADPSGARNEGVSASLDAADYRARFERLREWIREGHLYQGNLTVEFRAPRGDDPLALFEALARSSPAPYAACLPGEAGSVLSASPELFLARRGRTLVTRPIKGTRARREASAEDRDAARELLASEKDRAEHVMIVDVHRNDVGRVAEFGSVQVEEPWALESFATLHHLTSTITARERSGTRPLDAVRAAFPAGSITGAPKIRAMEVLAALEPHARGAYTGALGWFEPGGDFELAVGIRTVTVLPDTVLFPAGGGIVADSDPDAEYQEAWDKARSLWAALRGAAVPGAAGS